VFTGSGKTNSIPSVASAELDVRLLPDEDTAAFRAELVRVIDDPGITIELVAPVLPRFDAPLDTEMFAAIERAAARLLPGVPVASVVDVGTSDRPTYMAAGMVPYGVSPGLVEWEDERRGVHGIDERVSLPAIEFGLKLYAGILRELR
jgi:acetylornithine deacetylase/succinyl-diaminopimelate desuccinylase-like protein